ncbi:MAG: hypothetical protein IJL73_06555 [Lachnospiraceae bacterium]|nr:hypothetical protein [Lachnospiraceae bacterium]
MNKKEVMRQALGNIDDRLIAEELEAYENEPVRRKNRKILLKKAPLWVAAMLLLILLGGTTVYAIVHFQGEVKKEEKMISFSLDTESYRVDESLIKGRILEAKEITKKQYEQQSAYYWDLPGYYYTELSSADEVKAFIGYEKLIIPRMRGLTETSVRVEAYVSEKQKFENVTASIFFAPVGGVLAAEDAYLWTKDSPEDPGISLIGEKINDHMKIEYRRANGREFLLEIYRDPSQSEYVSCIIWWAEDTVLYSFYMRFIDQEKYWVEADKLMLEWMNSF